MTTAATNGMDDRFDGQLLLPFDAGYDEARAVWNAMVDKRPRMIIRCASVGDVVTAVRTARELGLEIGVRCGGHSVIGHAVPDDGLMIDLTPLNRVQVDPSQGSAWVQGGTLLGALDQASQQLGLATTAGNVSHTGVGGLTLGGGMGWLARQHGLTCDNVVSFQVVTADGSVVRASESEHPELFWGLRGGGGNFGVVTDFEFRLHPVGPLTLTAEFDFALDQAEAALSSWRDLSATAPRPATFTALLSGGLLTLGYVWVGDLHAGRELLPSLRALGRPRAERVETPSYVELQRRDDTVDGHQLRRYWKGHFLRELTDEAITVMVGESLRSEYAPNVSLQAYGGAIADVPEDAMAFSHRDTTFELVAATGWTNPAEDSARMGEARRYAATLDRFASGVYSNTLNDEGMTGVRRAYSPTKLARLTAVKDAYDPDNVFRLNPNIRPSKASADG